MRAVAIQHMQAKVRIHEQATNPVETMQSHSLVSGCIMHTHTHTGGQAAWGATPPLLLGSYRENGEENGNYYIIMVYIFGSYLSISPIQQATWGCASKWQAKPLTKCVRWMLFKTAGNSRAVIPLQKHVDSC